MRKRISVTHVVVANDGESKIEGYVTLALKPILRDSLPNAKKDNLPRGDYTVAFIGQIATSQDQQGKGIGTRLLYFALSRALTLSQYIGIAGVALDVLHDAGEDPIVFEKRRDFYLNRGFKPLIDDERLFISMKEIEKMGLL